MAFFSKSLYKDVGQNWKGVAALYLLLLLAITWLPGTFQIKQGIDNFVDKEAPKILKQIPEITIKDGKASIDKPVPYVIRDPDTGKPIIIIDTSGKVTSIADSPAHVLMTGTEVMYKKNKDEIRTYSFEKVKDMTFGQAQIKNLLSHAKWVILLLYPMLLLASFCYRIIQALIYGAIGVIFSKIAGAELTFQQTMRIAIVAITPAVLLSTVLDYQGIHYPYQFTSYFIISMVYLFFGVSSNKKS